MSAGICIMNRNAIAMAADSAVTVGDHAAIHNSANKLFSLSRVAPVGVIVYANAALMTVPIEIIVQATSFFPSISITTFFPFSLYRNSSNDLSPSGKPHRINAPSCITIRSLFFSA